MFVVVLKNKIGFVCIILLACQSGFATDITPPSGAVRVPLIVSAGVPLRVYVTKRLPMRDGEPVRAKLIDPVYAFDRIVVPAGAELEGHVTVLDPVSRMKRAQAILGGDFTPLHFARVEFTSILMPDGRAVPIRTADSEGLPAVYAPPMPGKKPPKNTAGNQPPKTGVLGTAKRQARDQLQRQVGGRTHGVVDLVRAPNKKEWLEDYLIGKLPYHPQWYRRNTRFDAVLSAPLDFGSSTLQADTLRDIGMPLGESTGQVRLLTDLSSADADTTTEVNGVLSQPIFSPEHKLVLPEGTRLIGHVKHAQPARWFHRGGELRFTFDGVAPPALTAVGPIAIERTPVLLSRVEPNARANVKVDPEGDAKATESKMRLLAPVLALMVASKAADNDAGRESAGAAGGTANYGGRTAGGFSGFGLLGSAAAQGSKTVGAALGYYGLAWTVYNTVISRGNEVEFKHNAAIEVRFGATAQPGKKLDSHVAAGGIRSSK